MSYFDTSVLVAYYVPETLSRQVQQRLAAVSEVTVSELTQVEFVSALSLRHRIGDLMYDDAKRISNLFSTHLDNGLYRTLHLDTAIYRLAHDYIGRFDLPLKAPDALHLAAAWQTRATLVTADRQLARCAEVLDISLDLIVAASG